METTQRYPTYTEIREHRLAERRAAIRRVLEAMDDLAHGKGGRLLVFGSLAEGGFAERSDVDVALLGLGPGADEALAARIDEALAAAGIEGDVIAERHMPESLMRRVLRHGVAPRALG